MRQPLFPHPEGVLSKEGPRGEILNRCAKARLNSVGGFHRQLLPDDGRHQHIKICLRRLLVDSGWHKLIDEVVHHLARTPEMFLRLCEVLAHRHRVRDPVPKGPQPREGRLCQEHRDRFFAGETLVPDVASARALSRSDQCASVPHDTFLRG